MLQNILYVSASWLVIFGALCGIGFFIQRLFSIQKSNIELTLSAFWIGFCVVLALLQVWHFFAPVNSKATILIMGIGLISLIFYKIKIYGLHNKKLTIDILDIILFLVICLFAASQAIGPIYTGDSGLYHISAIRWNSAYSIVPGLGNLHFRLAFNNSIFLFMSLFDVGYWSHKSQHIVNGLLLLVVFCEVAYNIKEMLTKREYNRYTILSIIFVYPIIQQCMLYSSSPSPDISIIAITIIISLRLYKIIFSIYNDNEILFNVFLIFSLAFIGITIKLSFIAIGLTAPLILLYLLCYRSRANNLSNNPKQYMIMLSGIILVTMAPWVVRSIILSGYLAYPIPFGSLDVEWKIPYKNVMHEVNWIKSCARLPGLPPEIVLANWGWLIPWGKQVFTSRTWLFEIDMPLLLAGSGILIILFHPKQTKAEYLRETLFMLPAVASLFYWFITAPDSRFAVGTFWWLGGGIFSLGYQRLNFPPRRKTVLIMLLITVIMTIIAMNTIANKRLRKSECKVGNDGFYAIPTAVMYEVFTTSGLKVYTPVKGDQCWDSPLPCTPNFDPDLRLREENRIESGFMVSPNGKQSNK